MEKYLSCGIKRGLWISYLYGHAVTQDKLRDECTASCLLCIKFSPRLLRVMCYCHGGFVGTLEILAVAAGNNYSFIKQQHEFASKKLTLLECNN